MTVEPLLRVGLFAVLGTLGLAAVLTVPAMSPWERQLTAQAALALLLVSFLWTAFYFIGLRNQRDSGESGSG